MDGDDVHQLREEDVRLVLGGPVWTVSLATGKGTEDFLSGFGESLKQR